MRDYGEESVGVPGGKGWSKLAENPSSGEAGGVS